MPIAAARAPARPWCVTLAVGTGKAWLARALAAILVTLPATAAAQTASDTEPAPAITLPPVEVIAPSPLPGIGIDRDKVPGTARSLDAEDFARTASPYVTDTLFQRIPDISLSDPNGNSAVQELSYRGFAASPLQIYFRIYLPLMAPALVAVGTYALLLAWNEYLYQFLLLSNDQSMTVAVALGKFLNSDVAPWNYMMATAIIYALPPLATYYAFRHRMSGGLTMGGVKG